MPYVRRDPHGNLLSLHRQAETGITEWLDDDAPEVRAFLAPADGFERLDADFIRVLEDLIDLLVERHVINITDLPAPARDKLTARRDHRRPTPLAGLNLLGDAPDEHGARVRLYTGAP